MQNKKIKIISVIVPIFVIILLVIIFWQKNKSQPKDVIDTSGGIIKNADEVNKIKIEPLGIKQVEKIQIKFSWEAGGIKYNDALYFTQEEYAKLTPEAIEEMKTERFENWVNTINTSSKQQ